MTKFRTMTARWVFPGESLPLERGTVTIDGGRIVAVAPAGQLLATDDLGEVAIVPGFVNAHTHLDLTGARGKILPSPDFTGWLRQVIAYRRSLTPEQLDQDLRAGVTESVANGTTLLGDISAQGLSWSILSQAPIRSVIFYELLGLPRDRARLAWKSARDWARAHPGNTTCRPGLSPHAPYSVRASLYRTAAAFARRERLALATHLAETLAERSLLCDRSGPFVEFLSDLDVFDPRGLAESFEKLIDVHAGANPVAFIHGNYLAGNQTIPANGTVVFCPRTYAAFGNGAHPFWDLLANGTRVALGTDSLASNPDLSVLEEARFLHRVYRQVRGESLLRMATLSGAEALGWADETGSLVAGKSADLVVLAVAKSAAADPHHLLFNSDTQPSAVMCRGRWIYGAASMPPVASASPAT